jgi:hypothetical protein
VGGAEVKRLGEVLLQQITFLATAPDSAVHPDVAVAQLEDVVQAISEAPADDRAEFMAAVKTRASNAAGEELRALRDLVVRLRIS